MKVGVPKEIKPEEYRVALIPSAVKSYVQCGHQVLVEEDAGKEAGFPNELYEQVGAQILPRSEDVWNEADLLIKVKEPIDSEYVYMRKKQIVYAYFHLAAHQRLTQVLLEKEVTAVAYETIQLDDGTLPALRPMSEIAGKMATQVGAFYLEKGRGGKGLLLGAVPGVHKGKVLVVGAGIVGTAAAKIALGLGAQVTLIDSNVQRLAALDDLFEGRIVTLMSNGQNLYREVCQADLLVGAVLSPGGRTPCLVPEALVAAMKPGSVIVDVAVDQGGCVETSRPTTHGQPTYMEKEVVHYCVSNMPGAVPMTSTIALSNATLHYGLMIANQGVEQAAQHSAPLSKGINTYRGAVTHEAVARGVLQTYHPFGSFLGS